ncbi:nitronate monooxygenase [Streptomyces sp. NPDC090499]|uniref:nitronate monooxygenase n=1 Tax=Streptomyces sp. NPDC090499 TaxID=3365965 RepID=UPI0038164A19
MNAAEALGVRYPLLQSGMGGVAGPELAAAVSNVGAAGCFGGYKLDGTALAAALDQLLTLTGAPVGINLIPEVVGDEKLRRQVEEILAGTPDRVYLSFFGLPAPDVLRRVRDAGRLSAVQVGAVEDARAAAEYTQLVIVQGEEAGGHLLGQRGRDDLIEAVRKELRDIAVVAAGGIGGRADADRAFAAGADGICVGTAFVPVAESRAHPAFKDAVIAAGPGDTVITDVYRIGWPGRRHRALRTAATEQPGRPARFIGRTEVGGKPHLVPRYSSAVPTVTTTGEIAEMAQYCGLSCASVTTRTTAATVVQSLVG